MNRFEIFYLLVLFCILFAPSQADHRERYKIKEAKQYSFGGSSRTFNNGDVYLYKITSSGFPYEPSYEVRDDSGEFSKKFFISDNNTIVTEDAITVSLFSFTVKIFTVDGNNAAFYLTLFSFGDFDHEFPVTRVAYGEKTLEGVFAVNMYENYYGDWISVAVDSSGPRLIFPLNYVKWAQEYEDYDHEVYFVVEHEPEGEEITVEFEHSGVANTFYAFIDSHK